METKIYLWVDGEGWKDFLLSDKGELEKREIKISPDASIGYGASIGNRASIGDCASIGNRASIGDCASIGNRASIGDCASIGEKVKPKCLFIMGSSGHGVSYWGEEKIQIGCKQKSFDEWQSVYEKVGNDQQYTKGQIVEYKQYIDIVIAFHSANQKIERKDETTGSK